MFSAGISKQVAASGGPVDPQFNYVTALLHGDGTNGAQNNTFLDTSGNSLAITRNGTPTQGTFSPYGSGWSNYFNGTSDYLSVPNSSAFVISGDFTIEAWVYQTSSKTVTVVAQWPSTGAAVSYIFRIDSTGKLSFAYNTTPGGVSGNNSTPSTSSITYNTWNHIVWTRSGTTIKYFINGVLDSTTNTVSGALATASTPLLVGLYNTSVDTYFNGYISNLRFVNGTAVYTSNFTPSTTPLTAITNTSLLTCQSNRFVDNSTNNYSITLAGTPSVQRFNPFLPTSSQAYSTSVIGGSGYFNGSTDYLTAPSTLALNLSSSIAWTIEAWVYTSGSSVSGTIIEKDGISGTNYPQYSVQLNGSGYVICYIGASNGVTTIQSITSSVLLPLNAWVHIAFVLNGNTIYLYQNGIQVASATKTATMVDSGRVLYIGYQQGATAATSFSGYISDARIVNGVAIYNSTFTPPNTPLGNNQSANANGSPSNALTAPITNSSQVIFNGTNQYLNLGGQTAFAFGSGSFTIEFWFYLKAASQTIWFCDFRNTNNTTQPGIALSTGTLQYYVNGAGQITGAANPSINAWHHLAVVRNGSSTVMYLDGIQTGSTFTDSVVYTVDASRPTIGSGGYTVGYYLNGYISNFRIVKGTAVYTSAFTPPTSPLTAITNTSLLTCQTPTIIDNSTNAFTITNNNTATTSLAIGPFGGTYAGVFNGTSQYLTLPSNTAFAFGTGNVTIEAWVYLNSYNSGAQCRLFNPSTINENIDIGGSTNSPGKLSYYNGTTGLSSAAGVVPLSQWTHIAFVRNGTTVTLYVNGNSVASSTISAPNNTAALSFTFGGESTGNYLNGYISNYRIVKGTAVYTSNFFPPQGPLTAITGTSLLTCQDSTFVDNSTNAFTITNNGSATLTNSNGPFGNANTPQLLLNNINAGIYDNAMINDWQTVGSAQVSSTQVKYGTGALKFNGTTDYLYTNSSSTIVFGGNFTIEAWVYLNTNANYAGIFSSFISTNSGTGVLLGVQNTGVLYGAIGNGTGADQISSASAITTSAWHHVAFVKNGTAITLYLDGTSVASGTTTRTIGLNTCFIGRYYTDVNNYFINGYIDDLRVTNGYARYTANFTPPTAAFPNYGR